MARALQIFHPLIFLAALAWGLAGMPARSEAQTLTTAREIAAHITPKGESTSPVALEAIVTYQDPTGTIFLRDDAGDATFITGATTNPRVPRGERLRITGVSHNGLYIGGIKVPHIERLGNQGPPEPREITPDELASGKFHYQWITLTGVGRSFKIDGETSASLRLVSAGKMVEIRFDEVPRELRSLVDAEIRVRGLAAADLNDHRQIVQPYVRVGDKSDIDVLAPAPRDPFEIAFTPLAQLQRSSAGAHRVKIHGVALAPVIAGGLFLRDDDRGVFVQCVAPEVKTGDVVEALGFPDMGFFSAQLSDAECRVVESHAAPEPRAVTLKELADGCDADLISAEAQVLQRFDRGGRTELAAQSSGINFTIFLPGEVPGALQPEALVRVTGVCRVSATRSGGYRVRPTAYQVWPRTLSDLQILRSAPWWTSRRLAIGLGGAALLALVALAWVALLRRQVRLQLAVIESKAQREAIIEERQRIAREFHDTLEQELAGLSLRLDAATPRVEDEKARSLLEQQQKLLQRLQTETRDFVWDLRDTSRQDVPLDVALRSLLEHLQANTSVPLQFKAEGEVPVLPALVQHHLVRITREAVNNAVKYSGAGAVEVSLENGADKLQLLIADHGKGFDVATTSTLEGHFGIRGMKERARKINAAFEVQSSAGQGTRVELTLPLPVMKT